MVLVVAIDAADVVDAIDPDSVEEVIVDTEEVVVIILDVVILLIVVAVVVTVSGEVLSM